MITVMSQNSYKLPKKKIAVVAKFDWYLEDAKHTFLNTQIEVTTFRSLRELSFGLENNSNFDFIFFPHVSEIIPTGIYENFLCIGFHTGDLPADRGGSPIQNKILTNSLLTSVSTLKGWAEAAVTKTSTATSTKKIKVIGGYMSRNF